MSRGIITGSFTLPDARVTSAPVNAVGELLLFARLLGFGQGSDQQHSNRFSVRRLDARSLDCSYEYRVGRSPISTTVRRPACRN
jgi:hypothetical protein